MTHHFQWREACEPFLGLRSTRGACTVWFITITVLLFIIRVRKYFPLKNRYSVVGLLLVSCMKKWIRYYLWSFNIDVYFSKFFIVPSSFYSIVSLPNYCYTYSQSWNKICEVFLTFISGRKITHSLTVLFTHLNWRVRFWMIFVDCLVFSCLILTRLFLKF